MGLLQKEAANLLGVNTWTVLNWEKGRTVPPIASIPAIVRFLGYDPFPQPKTLSEHLFAKRQAMGWSIEEAAKTVGVDPGTWGNWERGQTVLYCRHRVMIAKTLGISFDALNQEMTVRWNWKHERVR